MKKILLSIVLLYGACASAYLGAEEPHKSALRSKYFDTTFLGNYEQVARSLKEENFNEITFKSTDGLRLEGLYLKRPNAHYNVICCAGWWPGRKEGIATFYTLLPQDCNILFFDARGHGNSEGSYRQLNYGVHEYKDIIGALELVHADNGKPTLLYGLCAGAFNAAHAIFELQKQNRLEALQVSGLIFDSGWVSVERTAYSVATARTHEILMKQIASWYVLPHYREAQKTRLFLCAASLTNLLIGGVHLLLKPFLMRYESSTNLLVKAQKTALRVPCLFIHSHDDTSVSLSDVQKFAACVPRKECLWINKTSKHACHYLKHTEVYEQYLHRFIKSVIGA
jgi:pimeloyl-ACP methyl ester carboxylesterase